VNNLAIQPSTCETAERALSVKKSDKEELYRRLVQSRRFLSEHIDPETRSRITALVAELEQQLALVEARDADAPPE